MLFVFNAGISRSPVENSGLEIEILRSEVELPRSEVERSGLSRSVSGLCSNLRGYGSKFRAERSNHRGGRANDRGHRHTALHAVGACVPECFNRASRLAAGKIAGFPLAVPRLPRSLAARMSDYRGNDGFG